jgi:hypothetical protein
MQAPRDTALLDDRRLNARRSICLRLYDARVVDTRFSEAAGGKILQIALGCLAEPRSRDSG